MPRETKGKAGNTRKAGRGVIKGLVGLAKRRGDRESERIDPPPAIPRVCKIAGKQEEVLAGQWPGAPCDQLPPGCPIVPLGRDGTVSYFVDTEGQLKSVSRSEWGKRAVIDLFALTPNYAEWAWPRFGAARGEEEIPKINGLAADEAERCLVKAAASRGLFSPHDSVRGRGAWIDSYGRLIWHSGDRLWRIEGGKLKDSSPGEINDVFYPAKPKTVAPWPEPVPAGESPAQDIFAALQSWKWGRQLDPVLVLGGIGVMMVCGALEWRPHLFISGDKGVGKSELQRLIKGVLGRVLFKVAQPSEAGVRQHLGLDALPVAVDEMEGSADNRQVSKVIELACVASSGDLIARGGADHKGVLFQARSSFLLSGINPPSMRPQDRSRFAMIDLGQLGDVGEPPEIDRYAGPMLLRAIMDAWSDFERALADWKTNLKEAGFDQRAADTYGTLGAMAELMLGPEALDDAGIPITEAARLGALVAEATATERAEQTENWRACLEHLLGSVVDAWKGGEKPTVGSILEELEGDDPNVSYIKSRLGSAGLNLWSEKKYLGPYFLAVPKNLPALARLFAGSRWQDGGWWHALRQGVASGIRRAAQQQGGWNKARYTAELVTGATLMGALTIGLKDIARGRDPRDMTTPEFWGQAMAQGGGLGIFGDFFLTDYSRYGQSLGATLAGPVAGAAGDLLGLGQKAAKGEDIGADAVRLLGRYTPGSSIWYGRLLLERLVLDQIQARIDPDHARRWRNLQLRHERELGTKYFWRRGTLAPQRQPSLSNAGGRQ